MLHFLASISKNKPFSRPFALALGVVGLSVLLTPQQTQAQVPAKGIFTATKACPAQRAINGANPGNVTLTVGDRYKTVGFNSNRRTHILLEIEGQVPNRRWVSIDCGTFQVTELDSGQTSNRDRNSKDRRRTPATLFPFFDTQNNPIPVDNTSTARDISPPPPTLELFDRKILQLCGSTFNAPVSEGNFKRLLLSYPDVVRKLKQATNGELKPNRRTDAQFVDDLTEIWFKQKGFKHIFCGELQGNSIGGLHFYGRYLELQEKGIAGRIERLSNGQDAKAEVIDGSVYSFGVAIKEGDRIVAEHPIKGYSYVSNAQEMLLDATRAFKLFKGSNSSESRACLITITDSQTQPFQSVFVKKAGAIRTFYPDATPDERGTPACDR